MECPPTSAFSAARQRQQTATDAWVGGTITFADDDTVTGSVRAGSEGQSFGGPGESVELAQSLFATYLKTARPARPVRGDFITIDGRGYTIETVTGDNNYDIHWGIECRRTPGLDA